MIKMNEEPEWLLQETRSYVNSYPSSFSLQYLPQA